MRSLFWRVLASFWLAIALVAGLSILLGHMLNQDAWILSRHPGLNNLAQEWTQLYEAQGEDAAQELLQQRKRQYHIDVQVLNESGEPVVLGTFPRRAAALEARQKDSQDRHLPWRRLTAEYTSEKTGDTYLLIYRIPHPELDAWHRNSLLWPLSALAIALVVLTLFSLLVTLSITRPLSRLRGAVHDLGQTTYQQNSLARLANRRDEFGVLATDFNRMGDRLLILKKPFDAIEIRQMASTLTVKWQMTEAAELKLDQLQQAVEERTRELADANIIVQNSPTILYRLRGEPSVTLMYISHNITKFGHVAALTCCVGPWARKNLKKWPSSAAALLKVVPITILTLTWPVTFSTS